MEPIALLLGTAIATVTAGGLSALVSFIARRSIEPSRADIQKAESQATTSWTVTAEELRAGNPESPPSPWRPNLPAPSSPSSGADVRALEVLSAYARDLREEAGRIAKRIGADSPSAAHVTLAADRIGILRQRGNALADIGLALGGVLLGAAGSYFINGLTGGTLRDGTNLWMGAVGAAGITVMSIAGTYKYMKS